MLIKDLIICRCENRNLFLVKFWLLNLKGFEIFSEFGVGFVFVN